MTTTSQLYLDGSPTPDLDAQDLVEREANYTPLGVARQICEHLLYGQPKWILVPSAGYGAFASAARMTWPDAVIHAVEPGADEQAHLKRYCDRVYHARLQDVDFGDQRYDLVIDNPPFSQTREFVEICRPLLAFAMSSLALLIPADWYRRGEDRWSWWTEQRGEYFMNVPRRELVIGGPIAMRGDGKSDMRCYSVFEWGRDPVKIWRWHTEPLPWLPAEQRRWTVVPGMEAVR